MPGIEDKAIRTFNDMCILRATVTTTGFRGGDSGHGGKTEIYFDDLGSTDMEAEFSDRLDGEVDRRITLRFGGDAELRVLIKALRFSADALEALAKGSEDEPLDYDPGSDVNSGDLSDLPF